MEEKCALDGDGILRAWLISVRLDDTIGRVRRLTTVNRLGRRFVLYRDSSAHLRDHVVWCLV